MNVIHSVLDNPEKNFARYMKHQIEVICGYLGIDTTLALSSEVSKEGLDNVQDKVFKICREFGAFDYINAIGGQKLYDKKHYANNGVKLSFIKAGTFNISRGGARLFRLFLSLTL